MGKVRKVLSHKELEPRSVTPGSIWTDLCENVHLHYRNVRFDFSEEEWADFRCAINGLGMAVEQIADEKNYREGNPNFLIQQLVDTPLKTDSVYYTNRAVIELNQDNTAHFHYRDMRLHMSYSELTDVMEMFAEARRELDTLKPFPYKGITEVQREFVDINLIQPYDDGHRVGSIDNGHREGIDCVKSLIIDGRKIRPILVNDEGQRLDGFKRYMAHIEYGMAKIECIIDPWGKMGGQHNQSFIDDGG